MATDLQNYKQRVNDALKAGTISQAMADSMKREATRLANKNGDLGAGDRRVLNQKGMGNNALKPKPTPTPTLDNLDDGQGPPDVGGPDDIVDEVAPVYSNKPMPTGTAGDGMQWSPVYTTDADGRQWITDWVAAPIPGWKETPASGHSAADKAGAKQRLKELLTRYGLSELIDTVNGLVEEWGSNNDSVIMSYLRESEPYRQRFRGNEDRIAKGYGALSEAEYIGVETQIRAKMRDFGLGDAFYSNEKIAALIGGDVSADEVTDRLTKAKKIVDNADTNIKSSLVNLYGAGLGDLIGYVLDPALAQEGLQRKVNAGIAYGVAKGQGLDLDRGLSEQIGELTYGDERTARQSLGQAGVLAESVRRLKSIDRVDISDADVVEQQFGLDAEATRKVKKLQSRERARFTGSSGAFGGTLQGNNF